MSASNQSVLFLDKKMIGRFRKQPRGVEVFNLNLLRDLASLGYPLTAVVHESWARVVRDWIGDAPVELVTSSSPLGGLWRSVRGVWSLRGRRFSVLLLGNVASRLGPALALAARLRLAPACALIAHRGPTRRVLAAQRMWDGWVVCVNGPIAEAFQNAGFPRVAVDYGVTDADRFSPPSPPPPSPPVEFCVVGHLDSPWKGADTAVAAFRSLPAALRNQARLHLASFHLPPSFPEPNIRAHPWMPFSQMPDFLRAMHAMIVPSRTVNGAAMETFCQAMVQGMLTGLPIVANDLSILSEKIRDGEGLVFHDVAELASHMERLIGDPALRQTLGAAGRRTALARYAWNTRRFAERYLFPSPHPAGQDGVR